MTEPIKLPSLGDVEKNLAMLRVENDRLRAALANGSGFCIYCELPKDEWAKCARGFPGCSRSDDAMMCPHFGASLELKRREWVGLTDEEKHDCYLKIDVWSRCVEAVEAKLKEKNGG